MDATKNDEPTVESLQAQVDGMRAEGCAALSALSSIFALVTPPGMHVTARERKVADIAADVIVTAKSCDHQAQIEKVREILRNAKT